MIDYGECFFSTELKVLPKSLASIPPLATYCRLPITADPENVELQLKLQDELFSVCGVTIVILAVTNGQLVVDVKTSKTHKLLSERISELCLSPAVFGPGSKKNSSSEILADMKTG